MKNETRWLIIDEKIKKVKITSTSADGRLICIDDDDKIYVVSTYDAYLTEHDAEVILEEGLPS